MKKNMGTLDRTIRIVLALVVVVLYFMGKISGVAAIILGIFALIFIVTSFIGYCPLYAPLKLSTIKRE
ncbi:MAG: DUF2892 domain-containing protein [Syntrophaceae bacterium]|nr:DUF2892 domain-containing protein [Syntrophaceae bacterium]